MLIYYRNNTKESIYIRKEFNFHRIFLVHHTAAILFVWNINTAAVSLVWNTNMAAVTSGEKRYIPKSLHIFYLVSDDSVLAATPIHDPAEMESVYHS